jgi:hypothetical protein
LSHLLAFTHTNWILIPPSVIFFKYLISCHIILVINFRHIMSMQSHNSKIYKLLVHCTMYILWMVFGIGSMILNRYSVTVLSLFTTQNFFCHLSHLLALTHANWILISIFLSFSNILYHFLNFHNILSKQNHNSKIYTLLVYLVNGIGIGLLILNR